MERLKPIGFWSYARQDEKTSRDGRLRDLRTLLTKALQGYIGRETVEIFQDTSDIPHGEVWERKILSAIERANFFIPIVTPAFLESPWCLREVREFLKNEQRLGTDTLIFPIRYHEFRDPLPSTAPEGAQEVLDILNSRQWLDFTKFRVIGFDSPEANLLLDRVGRETAQALFAAVKAPVQAPPPPPPEPRIVVPVAPIPEPVPPPVAVPPVEPPRLVTPPAVAATPKPASGWPRFMAFGVAAGLALGGVVAGSRMLNPPTESQAVQELVRQKDNALGAQSNAEAALRQLRDATNVTLLAKDQELAAAAQKLKQAQEAQQLAQANLTKAEADFKRDLGTANDRRQNAENQLANGTRDYNQKLNEIAKLRDDALTQAQKANTALQAAKAEFEQQSVLLKQDRAATTARAQTADGERDAAKSALDASKAEVLKLNAQLKPFLEAAQRPPAPSVQPVAPAPNADKTFQEPNCPVCPKMVIIPAGKYIRGSEKDGPYAEPGHYPDERPARAVTIGSFMLGRLEVTEREFTAFADDPQRQYKLTDSSWRRNLPDHPVVNVSWNDADAYTKWLTSKAGGKIYTLATEAQWEYAARARTAPGNSSEFSTGTKIEPGQAQFGWAYSYAGSKTLPKGATGTAPAGSIAYENDFGLRDMHGNASEWVQDCYHDSYNDAPVDGRAVLSAPCEFRVVRGGSWNDDPRNLRSAYRVRYAPGFRGSFAGFRVARTL